VSAEDLTVAREFLDVLAAAVSTGERDAIYGLLAHDVVWLTPMRGLVGLDEVRTRLEWLRPPATLDVEFAEPELTDLGDGHIVSDVREVYRMKGSGDFAYHRDRRIDLTVRDGRIARYEMRVVG